MGIPNRPQRFRGGLPVARPIALPVAAPIALHAPAPIASPGNPLAGRDDAPTRYGRLTNPDLLVAAGQWVRVQSTFLWALRFVPYAQAEGEPAQTPTQMVGDLYLEFVNGFIGKWEGRAYQDYRAYLSAPSKGKHHRRTPWYSDYETVRAQQYHGAALAQRIAENG